MRKTKNKTLIRALEILSNEIQSQDGVANAAILEGAQRIVELSHLISYLWLNGNFNSNMRKNMNETQLFLFDDIMVE